MVQTHGCSNLKNQARAQPESPRVSGPEVVLTVPKAADGVPCDGQNSRDMGLVTCALVAPGFLAIPLFGALAEYPPWKASCCGVKHEKDPAFFFWTDWSSQGKSSGSSCIWSGKPRVSKECFGIYARMYVFAIDLSNPPSREQSIAKGCALAHPFVQMHR